MNLTPITLEVRFNPDKNNKNSLNINVKYINFFHFYFELIEFYIGRKPIVNLSIILGRNSLYFKWNLLILICKMAHKMIVIFLTYIKKKD